MELKAVQTVYVKGIHSSIRSFYRRGSPIRYRVFIVGKGYEDSSVWKNILYTGGPSTQYFTLTQSPVLPPPRKKKIDSLWIQSSTVLPTRLY